MAFYFNSLGLGELSQDRGKIINLFSKVKKEVGQDFDYKTYFFDDGLELVARIIKDGKDSDFVGVDSHLVNSNKVIVKPLSSLGDTVELPAVLFTTLDEKTVFVANLMRAGLVEGKMEVDSQVSLQLCAFPSSLEVYENRKAYEKVSKGNILKDKSVLPYFYIRSFEEGLSDEEKKLYQDNILFNIIAARVLETKQYNFGSDPCFVSTLDTTLGKIDILYSNNILEKPLSKNSYVVGAFYLSAEFTIL